MDAVEHYLQDAFELRAVALMQLLAEERGVAITEDSAEKQREYQEYLERRGVTKSELSPTHVGHFNLYEGNLQKHLPAFIDRLVTRFPGEGFDFVNVETEARNAGRREDFHVLRVEDEPLAISLKNYRNSVENPQVASGTYNSFIVNFLLESAGGPGMVLHPETGERFRGSTRSKRDNAITALGFPDIPPLLAELDALNEGIRAKFVEGEEFEFYDEDQFAQERTRCGIKGAEIAEKILRLIPDDLIRSRILTLAGLTGREELLFMDPSRCADSLTSRRFGEIRTGANDPAATVEFRRSGQSIKFRIIGPDGRSLLPVNVPFTINPNGAWFRPSSGRYEGTILKKDGKHELQLRYGQRRPYKSRELATSINTYIGFAEAGIFDHDEV